MTGSTSISLQSTQAHSNEAATAYFEHSTAPRVNTDVVVVEALRREYPQLHLTVTPRGSCDLLGFARAGHAAVAPIDQEKDRLSWITYSPPARRLNGESDGLAETIHFGKFLLDWNNKEYVLYIADGRDGSAYYPAVVNQYILASSASATERLLLEAGRWSVALHDEVWVFDGGFWQKSRELWESIQAAEWSNVILDEGMKRSLIRDVDNFFDGRETYQKLKVPWKRGVIYYGPPGNGKTISIKAMMHALYKRKDPVPTLYVKTLSSFAGPEYSIRQIFTQARRYAPCYLIFEDLDSLITPGVRSYFLNEVDGLKSNDGILMVGSTNHLDQLDPGIAKRPSRFDRKYYFPDPSEPQRVAYAKFWQGKLSDNKDVAFPDEICRGVANITDGFSFAYMQEAFIAALLALAARQEEPSDSDDTDDDDDAYSGETGETPSTAPQQMAAEEIPLETAYYLVAKRPDISDAQWEECISWLRCHELGTRRIVDLRHDRVGLVASPKEASAVSHNLGGCVYLTAYTRSEPNDPVYQQREVDYASAGVRAGGGDDLDAYPLWRELKKQVKNLKQEMDRDRDGVKAKEDVVSDEMERLRV